MKLKKLAAAAGIIAAFGATAVSAAQIDAFYNGERAAFDGEIINDRAMVQLDELCGIIGAQASAENGVWSFTKGEYTLSYDEKTGQCTASGAALELDAAPVMTTNEKLVPVRAFSEALGVKVGWDDLYGAVILHDFDAYMNKLKVENPEIYTLLTLQIKQPEQGAGITDMTMDIDVPAETSGEGFRLALKLAGTSSVYGGVEASGATLENLEIAAQDFNLALEDVTLDGIYDTNSGVMYLKTNAIEKIKDAVPSAAEKLDALSSLLPGDTWYKITMEEYISLIGEMTGVDNSAQMKALSGSIYGEGFRIDKLIEQTVNSEDAVNSRHTFYFMDSVVYILKAMDDCGALKASTDGEEAFDISIVFNNAMMKDFSKAMYAAYGMEWLEEDEEDFDAEFEDFPIFDINCSINIKEDASSDIDMSVKLEMEEMNMNITVKSSFDAGAETEEIALPETAQNMLPLLRSLLSLATVETLSLGNS